MSSLNSFEKGRCERAYRLIARTFPDEWSQLGYVDFDTQGRVAIRNQGLILYGTLGVIGVLNCPNPREQLYQKIVRVKERLNETD